jgi:hypothetical protein
MAHSHFTLHTFAFRKSPLYQPLYVESLAMSKGTEHKKSTFFPKCSFRDILSSLLYFSCF